MGKSWVKAAGAERSLDGFVTGKVHWYLLLPQWRQQAETECGDSPDWWPPCHLPGWALHRHGPCCQAPTVGCSCQDAGVREVHHYHFTQVGTVFLACTSMVGRGIEGEKGQCLFNPLKINERQFGLQYTCYFRNLLYHIFPKSVCMFARPLHVPWLVCWF